jgi:hypothetical protein
MRTALRTSAEPEHLGEPQDLPSSHGGSDNVRRQPEGAPSS